MPQAMDRLLATPMMRPRLPAIIGFVTVILTPSIKSNCVAFWHGLAEYQSQGQMIIHSQMFVARESLSSGKPRNNASKIHF